MGWNYLSIPKLQLLHRWNLGKDELFHPTFDNGCNYLVVLGLDYIHIITLWHEQDEQLQVVGLRVPFESNAVLTKQWH